MANQSTFFANDNHCRRVEAKTVSPSLLSNVRCEGVEMLVVVYRTHQRSATAQFRLRLAGRREYGPRPMSISATAA